MYENNFVHRNDFSFLTKQAKETNDLKIIKEMLSDFVENNFIELGTGYCISVSDMISTSLRHRGIKSKLVEVSFAYSVERPDGTIYTDFMGYDTIVSPGKIDTHVVVITETMPPYLIDASIQNKLPTGMHVLLNEVDFDTCVDDEILDLTFTEYRNLRITYKIKKQPKVSSAYQKSILERMNTDKKIFDEMRTLKILNIIGISLSIFSVVAVINQILRWYS